MTIYSDIFFKGNIEYIGFRGDEDDGTKQDYILSLPVLALKEVIRILESGDAYVVGIIGVK